MEEKRFQERVPDRYQVHFGPDGTPYVGFVKNLSEAGLLISTRTVYKPGTHLQLLLKAETDISLRGQVRWALKPEDNIISNQVSFDMGVLLTRFEEDYSEFFNKVKAAFIEQREHPRFDKLLQVSFKTPEDMVDSYTQNISFGGMFITTDDLLDKESIVEVKIKLLETKEEILVQGTVIYVVDDKLSKSLMMDKGVGVRLTKFFGDSEKKFKNYMSNLASR